MGCQGVRGVAGGGGCCMSRGQQRGMYEDTHTHTKALEGSGEESIQKVPSCGILKADSSHYATMWRPAVRLLN